MCMCSVCLLCSLWCLCRPLMFLLRFVVFIARVFELLPLRLFKPVAFIHFTQDPIHDEVEYYYDADHFDG